MKRSLFFFLLFMLGFINSGITQISSVKYLIEYNDLSGLYDCKIVIFEGEATTYPQRIQYNSLYTIVVPTGAQVEIEEYHNPLENNQSNTGTLPCLWNLWDIEIAPPAQPLNDFYTIAPGLSPVSAYNNLAEGDTITLFSVSIDVDPCENFIRPFFNGSDPSSLEMPGGGDFSNGFSIGSIEQIYDGNLLMENHKICSGACVELSPGLNCPVDDFTYLWSTGENTPTIIVCPDEMTTIYTVEITNLNMDVLNLSSTVMWNDPIVVYTGDDRLCIGETSSVSPNTGGTWISNNTNVATIDVTSGIITAVAQGAATFTFTDTITGCSGTTTGLIVDPVPSVATDSDSICISTSATLSPSTGGTWEALNPEIASLNNNIATGVSSGNAGFLFTANATGCISDTLFINVDAGPTTIITGPDQICFGTTTTMAPQVGGTWSSSDNLIATIDNFGNVTGIGEGCVTFTFTSASSLCASEPSDPICILPVPIIETPYTDLCLGATMSMSPALGGTWSTSNPSVATIDANTGVLTAISQGIVECYYISNETGCSVTSETITVHLDPYAEVDDPIELCVGMIASITPFIEGNWVSDNPNSISVDFNSGLITAISSGTAILSFSSSISECVSEIAIIAHGLPEVGFSGEEEICVGHNTVLFPNSGGTWVADAPSIATVDNLGNITGVNEGESILIFTDSATGCSSEPLQITVHANPEVSITGSEIVCLGNSTTASPTTGGTWTTNNPLIASIDSAGIITPLSEGYVSFTFSDGQCSATTEEIQVAAPQSIDIDTTICEGMSYYGFTASGVYTIDSIDAITGCDITTTIDLEVLPLSDPLCTVGIEDWEVSNLKVYPNPTSDLLFVESELKIESVSIFTIGYQKVDEIFNPNERYKIQISTGHLEKGLYFLAIKTRKKIIYKKLIVV